MSLPKVVSRDEWLVARQELLTEEKAMTRARDALNAKRRQLPMVEIKKDYALRRPEAGARWSLVDLFDPGAASSSSSTSCSTRHWDDGLSELHGSRRRELGRSSCSSSLPEHELRRSVARSARQDRAVQGEAGLVVPLVLVLRERLQLRLQRDHRRLGGPGAVELPHPRRARAARHGLAGRGVVGAARDEHLPARRRHGVPHVLDVRTGYGVAGGLVLRPGPDRARATGGVGGARRAAPPIPGAAIPDFST